MSRVTFPQKAGQTVHYQTNGTGRDSYIVRDNGGFCKMYNPVKWPEVTSFTKKRQHVAPAPVMPAKPVYYHSDGTGRDSYIM